MGKQRCCAKKGFKAFQNPMIPSEPPGGTFRHVFMPVSSRWHEMTRNGTKSNIPHFFNAKDMYAFLYPPYPKHIVFIYGALIGMPRSRPMSICVEWNDGYMDLICARF